VRSAALATLALGAAAAGAVRTPDFLPPAGPAADGGPAGTDGGTGAGAIAGPTRAVPAGRNAQPERSAAALPQTLSTSALCDELRGADRMLREGRAKLDEDRKAVAEERRKLEALAADVAATRAQLREETARLEAVLAKTAAPAARAAAAAPDPAAVREREARLETWAKALRGLKPEQTAALLSRVDRDLAVKLLLRLRPAESGPVLARLQPDLAAALLSDAASAGGPR